MFSAMATFKHTSDEQWEKMMEMLDRLGDRLEVMGAGQLRLQEQADCLAAVVAGKATEERVQRTQKMETTHEVVRCMARDMEPEELSWEGPRSSEQGRRCGLNAQGNGGTAYSVFDEKSIEEMVRGTEVLLGYNSHGLLQHDCERDVVPEVPWMFVGMSQQVSTYPMSREIGLTVAWDGEMQAEIHTHEGLLQQLAQGEEALKESAKKEGDIEDEASRPDPPSEETAVVMNGGNKDEFIPASVVSVLEDGPKKELDAENVDATSAGGILSQELAPESINETNGAGEIVGVVGVDDHEEEVVGSDILEAMPDEVDEEEGGFEGFSAIRIHDEDVNLKFLLCGVPCTLDACLLGTLKDGLNALLNIDICASKLQNRASAHPPLQAEDLSHGVATRRCEITTWSSAHVAYLVSGSAQTCFGDQLLGSRIKNEIIEKRQLVCVLLNNDDIKTSSFEPWPSMGVACETSTFELWITMPKWAAQVLKHLAPEISYRSLVALGIAWINACTRQEVRLECKNVLLFEGPMLDGELDCSAEPNGDMIPLKAARAMHPGAGLEENVQGLEVRLDELAALSQLNSDEHVQLQGLLKVAIDGPCYDSTQPFTLRLSSHAKWSAWQKLGSMRPEIALEKYINLLSQVVPRWLGSEIMDTKKYETECYSVGFISRADTSDRQNQWGSEDINSMRKDGRNMLLFWSTENVDRALEPYLMSNHNPQENTEEEFLPCSVCEFIEDPMQQKYGGSSLFGNQGLGLTGYGVLPLKPHVCSEMPATRIEHEVLGPPVVARGTAAPMSTEMSLVGVRWDVELFPDLGSHDGLFWQLAQGNEFMSSHENLIILFKNYFRRRKLKSITVGVACKANFSTRIWDPGIHNSIRLMFTAYIHKFFRDDSSKL
jgi:acyl-CoA-binding protein